MSRIPLIVLTADRPPELQGVGANQTIDQQQLFGTFVKWLGDSGVPENGDHAFHLWSILGARAIFQAVGAPPGPCI